MILVVGYPVEGAEVADISREPLRNSASFKA